MSEINFDQIEELTTVREIPDYLRYIDTGIHDTYQFLDRFGIDHNPESIVLEDSFNTVFYGNNPDTGEFEIWVAHKSVPYLNADAFKIDTSEINQYEVSMHE